MKKTSINLAAALAVAVSAHAAEPTAENQTRISYLGNSLTDEPLKIASPALDPAVVGEAYRFEILPAFGKAPRKWKVADGDLPAGISLSEDGILSGTSEKVGTSSVTLAVADASGNTASRKFDFRVDASVPPRIPEQSIPAMSVGKFSEHRLLSEAGNGIHTWRVKAGEALPPGLNLDVYGRLWGSPGLEKRHAFTLEVIDGKTKNPGVAERSFTVEVGPAQGDVAFARVTWGGIGLPRKMTPHWTIGMDVMLVDDAKDGAPKSMLVWQGGKDNDPSQFGTIVLSPAAEHE